MKLQPRFKVRERGKGVYESIFDAKIELFIKCREKRGNSKLCGLYLSKFLENTDFLDVVPSIEEVIHKFLNKFEKKLDKETLRALEEMFNYIDRNYSYLYDEVYKPVFLQGEVYRLEKKVNDKVIVLRVILYGYNVRRSLIPYHLGTKILREFTEKIMLKIWRKKCKPRRVIPIPNDVSKKFIRTVEVVHALYNLYVCLKQYWDDEDLKKMRLAVEFLHHFCDGYFALLNW